jgi:DNA polymerase (family 10)
MDNQKIAQIFQEIGDILDIQGENRFRVLAYNKAAQEIANWPREMSDVLNENPKKLEEIPGIGKDLALKIVEMLKTGKCQYHEDLLKKFDKGLLQILRLRGVGPKKVKLFYSSLQINNIEKLRAAATAGMLRDLPGMGEKSEQEILKSLEEYDKHTDRMLLSDAMHQVEKIIAYLKKCPLVKRVEYAGSLRRRKETIGDLDILVATKNPAKDAEKIMDYFVKYPEMDKVIGKGETKTSIILKSGVQSDLRVLDEKIFGAALHYFTGSKDHNIVIRDKAKKMGLKISEYGVFRLEKARGGKEPREILIGGKTEEEIFKAVGLPYIEPEMRENRGEFQAAEKGKLPKLIRYEDLRGDLHVHSKWSDGACSIEEIARAYRDAGFEYIALTDHSPAVTVAHGLSADRFELQWDEIDAINKDLAKEAAEWANNGGKKNTLQQNNDGKASSDKPPLPFTILKGVECDIKPDGTMDLPNSVLKHFDVVVASIHSRFNMSLKEQTERVLKAFKNPYVTIFGHPSGRLINQREPYEIDMEAVINAAVEHDICLEIDGQPDRLDLFDFYCKMAKEKGAKFTVDSDSHHTNQMTYLNFALAVAKRGWLEKSDVMNTMGLKDLKKFLIKRKG